MTRIAFLSLTHRYDDTRVLHKEARSLRAAGYDVVHVAPHDGRDAPSEVNGVRIRLYGDRRTGRVRRALGLWRAAMNEKAHIYHCNEVESWLLGCVLKLLNPRSRIVFDVHEHYPSRFTEGGRFPVMLQWFGGPLTRVLYRALGPWTDHFVFAKRSVVHDFRPRPGQSTLVFNYAPQRLQPPARDTVSQEIRALFNDGPVAIHIGEFSRARGWPQLLAALSATRNPQIRVIALGEVVEGEDVLMAEARRLGVADRVCVIARVPYADLFAYLTCAHVGLMLYQPGILNHVYAFPMKLYDYMLAGLPVIGPDFAPEVTPVVQEHGIGWLLDTSDPTAIASALDAAAVDPINAASMGARARAAVASTYNWEHEAEKLVAIYRRFEGSTTTPGV